MDKIIIKGAKENNLKNIDLTIPKNKLVVLTGLSGSGKTSLAFDTIYQEGQRRYVESLSSYARQFLGGFEKPNVDSIEGLSPAISIDQKTTSKNPRSTVGTVTEIYDYLRLLYSKIGVPYCPSHNLPIKKYSIEEIVNEIFKHLGEKIYILSKVILHKNETLENLRDYLLKEGIIRLKIDDSIYNLDEEINYNKIDIKDKEIFAVIDRLIVKDGIRSRLFDSLEIALRLGKSKVYIEFLNEKKILIFTEKYMCPICDFTINNLEPKLFSFNSPLGACPDCNGIGTKQNISAKLVVDYDLSLNDGALIPYRNTSEDNLYMASLKIVCDHFNIDMDKPFKQLTKKEQDILLYGSNEVIKFKMISSGNRVHEKLDTHEGIIVTLERRFKETNSEWIREWLEKFTVVTTCPTCKGKRLNNNVLRVYINNYNISDLCDMSIKNLLDFFNNIKLNNEEKIISELIINEIKNRLKFLSNVGLEYLTLSRYALTLSGGEAQRIRLATQIGSKLTGVLYVLDEPSIGLHQRDNEKLIKTLKDMRDLGNSVLVVEHDEDTMRESDFLIDIGPGAGVHGGNVVAAGTPLEVMNNPNSITGRYLKGLEKIQTPLNRRKGNGSYLEIKGARQNNLKNINLKLPLGTLILVTGVSGSGKSSLVNEVIYKNILNNIGQAKPVEAGLVSKIKGLEHIERIIDISQSPIGRTPRSNPATYTGVFDDIRDLYTNTNEAKIRGYQKGRFSFNVKGGRCEACMGDGVKRVSMHFLPDVYVPCEVCHGKRYNYETLQVKYKDKNIADVLDMTVEDALVFFDNFKKIKDKLKTINDVGLGYIKLGQSATTLSGGEAQRVKLASELYKKVNKNTLIILDEPTTGLHSHDIKKLIEVINKLVDQGATVIIIEHNLDVIKQADYIIDLGPEGGDEGGNVVFFGSVEEIIKCKESYTGKFLKKILEDK